MKSIWQYRKAIIGGLVAGVSAYLIDKEGGMTSGEWWEVISAVGAGAGFTWITPNAKKKKALTGSN